MNYCEHPKDKRKIALVQRKEGEKYILYELSICELCGEEITRKIKPSIDIRFKNNDKKIN
ncbi:MAG: hypothetical protein V3574_04335 [Candidatus Moraniibacteriota bacterium]